MDVSLVVLTWDDADLTTACVRSLPHAAEIIVVDNGSSDAVARTLTDMCAATGARYVRSDVNLGYAKGMNLGIKHCTRDAVILVNNDVVTTGAAVDRLVGSLADPSVGAAFPTVMDRSGAAHTEGGRMLTVPIGLAHATGLDLLLSGLRITAPPSRATWFTGPFVALRRDTLDRIGGVDETSEFYAEDLRLCRAVQRLGLRVVHVPDAVVVHENRTSARRRWTEEEIARRQTREFIRACRDYGGRFSLLACAAYAFGTVARALVAPGSVRRAMARGAVEGVRTR